jgi:hypothetical protein
MISIPFWPYFGQRAADVVLAGAVMTSMIAALTVGGKAIGKKIAVRNADSIIFKAAKIVAWGEELSGLELFKSRK